MTSGEFRITGALFCFIAFLAAQSCSTTSDRLDDFEALNPAVLMEAPLPDDKRIAGYDAQQVQRGKYLTELLGCGSCHTDGALIGEPDPNRQFAGSHVGIAISNPLEQKYPGVVYPSNITPDPETGIGSWSDAEILETIRYGIDRHGRQQLAVMPWPAYAKLTDEDANSIVVYLRSLAAVRHRVPDNVAPGKQADDPYVHFGVYRSRNLQ
jgi:mono/diheme cytochrome c family protein